MIYFWFSLISGLFVLGFTFLVYGIYRGQDERTKRTEWPQGHAPWVYVPLGAWVILTSITWCIEGSPL